MNPKKVFLGFDPYRLRETLSYACRDNLVQNIKRTGIAYTFNPEDDFDTAIFASAEDMITMRPKIVRKEATLALLAAFDIDDFNDDPTAKKFLSDASINCANDVDFLITFFESQMRALLRMGIRKEIRIFHPSPTYESDEILTSERSAFRSFFRIPKEKTVVVSFGFKRDAESFSILENLSRVFPDYEFLYFGNLEKEFLRRKMQERLAKQTNIHYVSTLPEELYHSALLSIDAVFFPQVFLTYPTILFDFISHGVPIVASRAIDLPELVNEKTALLPRDFPSLYKALRNIKTENKAAAAKANLLGFML